MRFDSADHSDSPADSSLQRMVIDTASVVIIGMRPDHRIVSWNRAAEILFRTPRERAIGLDYVEEFLAPQQRAAVVADIAQVLDGKASVSFEADVMHADRSRRTMLWNLSCAIDSRDEPIGVVATGTDITESKEAEQRYRLMFEYSLDGVLLSDSSGLIDCNPAAVRMLGLAEKSELIGRGPFEFSPQFQPDGMPSDEKARGLGELTLERGALRFDWMHQQPDGTPVPVEVSVRHAYLRDRPVSVIAWRDQSQRVTLEHAREETEKRSNLAQKMEAIGRLAGGVAHDFNNLLAIIRNSVQLALLELQDNPGTRRDLEVALEGTDRGAKLTAQLLAFSRQQSRATEPLDLAELVRDTLPLIRSSLLASIVIELHASGEGAWVQGDRSQLEQVLVNLILNARDAMPTGGRLSLSIGVDRAAQQATLVVSDTGVGIPPDVQQRIFEPFFTTKSVGKGTGLGLAFVYGVVTQAGGSIRVESEPGAGTSMLVTLPISGGPALAVPAVAPTVSQSGDVILLVDDDPAVRSTTRRLLERLQFTVLEASNGAEALRIFEAEQDRVTVLLTDIRMPEMDGVALAKSVQQRVPEFPIVFVSGFDEIANEDIHGLTGAQLVSKPFASEALVTALRAAAARRAH